VRKPEKQPLTVRLVDTTLRDGEQAPGLAFSSKTRLSLAMALDRGGIYQLETGCPAMGQPEEEKIRDIKMAVSGAKISVWSRIRRSDVLASLRTYADIIHLCLPVTENHLTGKLGKSWSGIIRDLTECLELIRQDSAQTQVSVGLEDISRAGPEEIVRAAEILRKLAVFRVRVSDTVGILTPSRTRSLVGFFVNEGFEVEFHAHDDLGLAEANTLTAGLAGAKYLDTTLGGIGERAGNCGLARLIAVSEGQLSLGLTLSQAEALESSLTVKAARRAYILKAINSLKSGGIPEETGHES
jgi:homocitrate synthase NifV